MVRWTTPRPPGAATALRTGWAASAAFWARTRRIEWSMDRVSIALFRSSGVPVRRTLSKMLGGTIEQMHPCMPVNLQVVASPWSASAVRANATRTGGTESGRSWKEARDNGRRSVQVDRVAQLLEEALRHLLGLAREAADLAEQRLLVGRQVLRHHDLDHDELVSTPAGADVGHATARQPERLPILRAGGHGDLDVAVERRDLDLVSQRRLHHVDPQLVHDVLVLAAQGGVVADPQHHVQVAGRAAAVAGLALPREADLGARVHAGRDAHAQPLGPLEPALSTALRARRAQDPARPGAGRARGDVDHRAEDRLGLSPDLPAPAAGVARLRAGPRLGAAAAA